MNMIIIVSSMMFNFCYFLRCCGFVHAYEKLNCFDSTDVLVYFDTNTRIYRFDFFSGFTNVYWWWLHIIIVLCVICISVSLYLCMIYKCFPVYLLLLSLLNFSKWNSDFRKQHSWTRAVVCLKIVTCILVFRI